MKDIFTVTFNNNKTYNISELPKVILPETINSMKIELTNNTNDSGVSVLPLLLLIESLLNKTKNPSEYTMILHSIITAMILTKKLEFDAGLGLDTY